MSLAEELSQAAYLDAPGKAALYNSLLDAGYSDAQIRAQADQMFGDQSASWSQLTSLAQSLRQQSLPAAPEGLMSQGTGMAQNNPNLLESLFAQMTPAEFNNYSMMREIGVNEMIPLTTIGGKSYFQNSDGSIVEIEQTGPVGANQTIYSPEGQVVEQANLPNYNASNPVTNAFVGGTLGLMLGPAVLGLSAPAAAAIAAGGPRLNETGSLTEAAKAAALAGLTAYGAESLLGSLGSATPLEEIATELTPTEYIQQLLESGVDADLIAQNVANRFPGYSMETAAEAVLRASAPPSASAGAIPVTGSRVLNPAAITASTGGGLLGGTISTLPPTAPSPNRVEVPGSRLPTENLTVDDLLAVLSPAITGALPPVTGGTTQQVGVTGSREPPASTTPGATGGAAGSALVPTATAPTQQVTTTGTRDTGSSALGGAAGGALGGIVPGIQPAIPTASDRVEVPGKREPGDGTIPAIVGATLPTIPSTLTQPLPEVAKPPAEKEESLFTPSDILKLLALLGGGAAAGSMGGGGGNVPVRGLPPSDTLIGSTTPQFGSDYYAAVQRYYNAFMPETPRNVAGPLQQWYENKFGA